MKNKFEYTPLGKIAQIDISGVDKKIKENERQVRLCNFVDVYHNWAITQDLYKDFMIASANEREIDLFKIKKGQVAITKDSETRDDIGIATYIADDFQDVILGYHTALITPNDKLLNGKFLNAFLHTSTAKKHFENNASGSGQRYTLTNDSISSIKVPLYDIKTQEKIGNLFTLIDKKIVNNNKTNKILENLAKTIYDYWFVQYEFPNKEGNPYKSSGGKMLYNKILKKEIPEIFEVANLMNNKLCKDIKSGVDYFLLKNYLPTSNVEGEKITDGDNVSFKNRESRANMQPTKYSVWFAKMKNSVKHISIPMNSDWFINKYILSTGFQGLQCDENSFAYIHSIINSSWFEKYKDVLSHGATQEAVNNEDLKNVSFIIPTQEILDKYNRILLPILEKKFSLIKENQVLESLRDFLLPLLMNGQVTIKEAEEKVDQTIKEENITMFPNYDLRFELWLQNQGLAARGDIDRKTLREIFDAMDDNDK